MSDSEDRDGDRREVATLVSGPPVVVGREGSLRAAARQLELAGAGAAVVGHTRRVEGVISEHHVAEAVARGRDLDATPVEAYMTPYFSSVEVTATIEEAKQEIRQGEAHFLAATVDGQVVGLLSAEDVLRIPSPVTR